MRKVKVFNCYRNDIERSINRWIHENQVKVVSISACDKSDVFVLYEEREEDDDDCVHPTHWITDDEDMAFEEDLLDDEDENIPDECDADRQPWEPVPVAARDKSIIEDEWHRGSYKLDDLPK